MIESIVDDTVETEQPDDNDVNEVIDETDDESDGVANDDTNEVAVNTIIDNEEDLGTNDDEYYYGNFKIHFASIPILLLSFVF